MREGDLDRLVEIDRAGTHRLARHGFPSLLDHMIDRDGMARLVSQRAVWVAADPDDRADGFAVAQDIGPCLHLHELSVDPDHARRGIGGMLLSAVIDHARWAFHTIVSLETFRTVPFNAPFYATRGFTVVEPAVVPEEIAAVVADGRPPDIHPGSRVVMVRRI